MPVVRVLDKVFVGRPGQFNNFGKGIRETLRQRVLDVAGNMLIERKQDIMRAILQAAYNELFSINQEMLRFVGTFSHPAQAPSLTAPRGEAGNPRPTAPSSGSKLKVTIPTNFRPTAGWKFHERHYGRYKEKIGQPNFFMMSGGLRSALSRINVPALGGGAKADFKLKRRSSTSKQSFGTVTLRVLPKLADVIPFNQTGNIQSTNPGLEKKLLAGDRESQAKLLGRTSYYRALLPYILNWYVAVRVPLAVNRVLNNRRIGEK